MTSLLLAALIAGEPVGYIVHGGRSNWAIYIAQGSGGGAERAAKDIQTLFREHAGVNITIYGPGREGPPQPRIIISGDTFIDAAENRKPLRNEAYRISSNANLVRVSGGGQRGPLYGGYQLLRDTLGMEWFTPTITGGRRKDNVHVPPTRTFPGPAFAYRELMMSEAFNKDWAAPNRLNGNFTNLSDNEGGRIRYSGFAHTFKELLPPERYFQEHPEWYALVDGKRKPSQICLSSPAAREELTKNLKERIKLFPEAKIFSVSQNDSKEYCKCKLCQEAIRQEGSPAGPVLRFVNAVAREIEADFPKVWLDTLAYDWSEKPPKQSRPHSNVVIRFAPIGACIAHALNACTENKSKLENLKGWAAISPNLYVWDYTSSFLHYLQPVPNLYSAAENLRLYRKLGVDGVMYQGAYEPGTASDLGELKAYYLAQMLWNPAQEPEAVLGRFLKGVYGSAAPQMRQWLNVVHSATNAHHIHTYDGPTHAYLNNAMARGDEIFDKAEKQTEAEPVAQEQVRRARLGYEYVKLLRMHSAKGSQPSGALKRQSDKVLAMINKFGIKRVREGQPLEEFVKRLGS